MSLATHIHKRRRVKPEQAVRVDVLGPVEVGCFAAGTLEVVAYRTHPETSYAVAIAGDRPVEDQLVSTPISSFGANVLAFEILSGGLPAEHQDDAVMTLAAWVFGSQLDSGGADRQRKHLEEVARSHGFGEKS
jgi:hypothetical protein